MKIEYIRLKHAKWWYAPLSLPIPRFCMFEPNIFSFHTCYVTDNHFPKDKTVFQLS
ncbi:hypothetical protein LDENG_00208100 [Lucifuga dentata]|nr:hypothetical protein LDENG_00208100 [Lucifuga dentata]